MPDLPMSSVLECISHFFMQDQPEPRRIFHGRGHLYPGLEHLNIDWFGSVVLLIAYQPINEKDLQLIIDQVRHSAPVCSAVILQQRHEKNSPSICLWGECRERIEVTEANLTYEIQPGVNQNAGLFLDTRLLRQWLVERCAGLHVLNLFAYTCSLSVAALAGGASGVVNVDMSRTALDWGRRNHELNSQQARAIHYVPHNLFKSWNRIHKLGRYDLIIIDPPSRQPGSFDAERDYKTILKRLRKLSTPQAIVIATVNSPWLNIDFLPHQFTRYAPEFRLSTQLPQSPEFADQYPERALKIYQFKRVS